MLARLGISLGNWCQCFEFLLDGRNVGVQRHLEQTDLSPIDLLTAASELPALEGDHLVGEFVDLGLAVQDVAVGLGDGLALLGNPVDQLCSQSTQLFYIQTGE